MPFDHWITEPQVQVRLGADRPPPVCGDGLSADVRFAGGMLPVHGILGEEFGHGSIVGSPPCLRVRIDPRSDGVSTGHAAVLWAVQISSEGHRSAQPGGMCSSGGTAPAGAWSSTSRSTVKPFAASTLIQSP